MLYTHKHSSGNSPIVHNVVIQQFVHNDHVCNSQIVCDDLILLFFSNHFIARIKNKVVSILLSLSLFSFIYSL